MKIKNGAHLREGCWYVITDIDPNDPNPSLKAGTRLLCAAERAGCIDPENHEDDGMGTQWFADFDKEEGAYRTLVTGVAYLSGPETAGEKEDSNG